MPKEHSITLAVMGRNEVLVNLPPGLKPGLYPVCTWFELGLKPGFWFEPGLKPGFLYFSICHLYGLVALIPTHARGEEL